MKLTCPVCGQPLTRIERSAVCPKRHSFDYAKSGYLNLLLKQSVAHGDNPEMVKARTNFLNTGAYSFLKQRLCEITAEERAEVLADLGCGEGYYTEGMCADEKYGFDLSKDALKHAARYDRSTSYAVSSIFHLPLADASVDTCVTCFAPVADEEIRRVLKQNGRFILVLPAKRHLFELKELLYDTPYENSEEETQTGLALEREEHIEQVFTAEKSALPDLFMMTPYAYHTPEEAKNRLLSAERMDITASFVIRIYRKK